MRKLAIFLFLALLICFCYGQSDGRYRPPSTIKPRLTDGRYRGGGDGRYQPVSDGRYRPANDGRYVPDDAGRYSHVDVTGGQYTHNDVGGGQYSGGGGQYSGSSGGAGGGGGGGGSGSGGGGSRGSGGGIRSGGAARNSGGSAGAIVSVPQTPQTPRTTAIPTTRPTIAIGRGTGIEGWKIVRDIKEEDQDGYHYLYETENKILAEESGRIEQLTSNDQGLRSQGFYEYVGDDGILYRVDYVANDNGFIPRGDHIPTTPPEIVKLLAHLATKKPETKK